MLTFLPATESDAHLLTTFIEKDNDQFTLTTPLIPQDNFHEEINLHVSNETSKSGDVSPINKTIFDDDNIKIISITGCSTPKDDEQSNVASIDAKRELVFPIYVYDCSLAILIDSLVTKQKNLRFKDIYRDNTFKLGEQIREDFIHLKPEDNIKAASPEPKTEDFEYIVGGKSLFFIFLLT